MSPEPERLKKTVKDDSVLMRILCISLSLLFTGIAAGSLAYSHPFTLRIKDSTNGREVAAIPVSRGDLLKVEYVHSMYKVKQTEVFSIGSDLRFYLKEVNFGSFAAAAYYAAGPCLGPTFHDGLWSIQGDGKNYSGLKYRIGSSTEHVLSLRNWTLDLSRGPEDPDRLIEISLEGQRGQLNG